MLHYLVDGYNLLYALPQMPAGSWQDKRLERLKWLLKAKPYGKNQATVIFDNRQGWGNEERYFDLSIIYTSGETADDWIIRKVRETNNPRVLVVVSNDKGIERMIRGTGARWTSAQYFVNAAPSEEPSAPPTEAENQNRSTITDELRKRWLGD
jgi:predicted RNA-binding protein with PIN domain